MVASRSQAHRRAVFDLDRQAQDLRAHQAPGLDLLDHDHRDLVPVLDQAAQGKDRPTACRSCNIRGA